jgi:hypothetical protein
MGGLVVPGIPGFGQNPYGTTDPYGDPYSGQNAPLYPLDVPAIDHVTIGLSRVIQQFRESPKFLAVLAAILADSNEQESTLTSFQQLPNIDAMQGANLDTIGIIVGASRFITNVVQVTFFGFDEGYYYMIRFGELGDPSIGGRFYELGETFAGTSELSDPEFRLIIRAKIVKNGSKGTGEDVLAALTYLFGSTATVTDNFNMTFTIGIGRAFTATELAILNGVDILPRPAGVGLILP